MDSLTPNHVWEWIEGCPIWGLVGLTTPNYVWDTNHPPLPAGVGRWDGGVGSLLPTRWTQGSATSGASQPHHPTNMRDVLGYLLTGVSEPVVHRGASVNARSTYTGLSLTT